MSKPNTMNDTVDEILRVCGFVEDEWGSWHFPNSSGADLGQGTMSKAKALITAKLEEVDRAAYTRATKYHLIVLRDTLVEPPIRTVSRVHAAIELLEKELASLKGGDV